MPGQGTQTTRPPAPDTGAMEAGSAVVHCEQDVTVEIKFPDGNIACPGHPLMIKAEGKPAGGAYLWGHGNTYAKLDKLLVGADGNPATSGDTVFLRSFAKDDTNGEILE